MTRFPLRQKREWELNHVCRPSSPRGGLMPQAAYGTRGGPGCPLFFFPTIHRMLGIAICNRKTAPVSRSNEKESGYSSAVLCPASPRGGLLRFARKAARSSPFKTSTGCFESQFATGLEPQTRASLCSAHTIGPRFPRQKSNLAKQGCFFVGAGNGARTRHLRLGKAALYQMSYSRE